MTKIKGLAWVLLTVFLAVFVVIIINPLVRLIPWQYEEKLSHIFLEKNNSCKNVAANQVLKEMIAGLYPLSSKDHEFSIDISVIQSNKINAYATLGGKIFLTSELLKEAESPEEIAGILSHEIAHVENRHIMQAFIDYLITVKMLGIFTGDSSNIDLLRYSMDLNFTKLQENQADEDGLKRLKIAQIDNKGLIDFFKRMEEKNHNSGALQFISDHPSNSKRIELIKKSEQYPTRKIMSNEDWKVFKNFCDF